MKRMKIRRADSCAACGADLPAATVAWWDAGEKVVRCVPCVDAASATTSAGVDGTTATAEVLEANEPAEPGAPVVTSGPVESVEPSLPVEAAVADEEEPAPQDDESAGAGASAQAEYERRTARARAKHEKVVADDQAWRKDAVERRPVLGRLATAITPRPTAGPEKQSTTAWRIGAEGERRVAEVLTGVAGIEVLHDRRVPNSRANIDHLVVGPAGIYVVDAKKYKQGSAVEARDVGGFLRSDMRLYVGGRDRTKLVEAVLGQVEVVRLALGPDLDEVPVRGVLCFVGSTWGLPKRTRRVRGVTAVWPKGLPRLVTEKGPHAASVESIADALRTALPPAM